MKNQKSIPAKVVAKKLKEKRVNIGEATFNIVTEHINNINALSNQLELEKQALNKIVTTCIEAAGVKIIPGLNTGFDGENKQFIISE